MDSWGLDERFDVFVINFISNHKDYKNTKIGLLSICIAFLNFAFGMEKEMKNLI